MQSNDIIFRFFLHIIICVGAVCTYRAMLCSDDWIAVFDLCLTGILIFFDCVLIVDGERTDE